MKDSYCILVVDDDPQELAIIEMLLAESKHRFEIKWLNHPEVACQELIEGQFDIALIDYRIGETDGSLMLEKAVEGGCRKPLIMLTGQGDPALDEYVMKIGAADYLPKSELTGPLLTRTLLHAIERASLLDKLHFQLGQDELTGLFNRRFLDQQLAFLISAVNRHEFPLSICLGDLDHFKQINDQLGHLGGDRVLRRFADIVQKNIRNEDIAARFGGDEFCILFPHVCAEKSLQAVERIREQLHSVEDELPLSGSFGLVDYQKGLTAKEILAAADAALYDAKEKGRNRCIIGIPN